MGGEGRPWAIAAGFQAASPKVWSVADPRVQPDVAPIVESFGTDLVDVFREGVEPESTERSQQIWLPDPSHLDLLHQMAFAYAYERWPLEDMSQLNRVGKLFNCLFLQSTFPAQMTALTATDALRSLFIFPATPARQGHLGFLIEWLNEHGSRTARLNAASNAEERAVSTSIDGQFERRILQPLLRRYIESNRTDSSVAAQIRSFVEEEARKRWEITVGALRIIRRDPRPINSGVSKVKSLGRQSWSRLWLEPVAKEEAGKVPGWRGRETDRTAVAAARHYLRNELASRLRLEALAHGDVEIAKVLVRQGSGLVGNIVAIDSQAATIDVHFTEPENLDIREGTTYKCFGNSSATLQSVESDASRRHVKLSVSEGQDAFRIAQRLLLIEHAPDFLTQNKIDNMNTNGTRIDQLLSQATRSDEEGPTLIGGDE